MVWLPSAASMLLSYAAISKLLTLSTFEERLTQLGIRWLVGHARVICIAELVIASMLIVVPRVGALPVVGFVAGSGLVHVRAHRQRVPCGCFGGNAELESNTLSLAVLGVLTLCAFGSLIWGGDLSDIGTRAASNLILHAVAITAMNHWAQLRSQYGMRVRP